MEDDGLNGVRGIVNGVIMTALVALAGIAICAGCEMPGSDTDETTNVEVTGDDNTVVIEEGTGNTITVNQDAQNQEETK